MPGQKARIISENATRLAVLIDADNAKPSITGRPSPGSRARHLLDQHGELDIDRRSTAAVGIGPVPADQPPMPAQQRPALLACSAATAWGAAGPGRRASPGRPAQLRSWGLPPQHSHLLAQHQQRHPPGQADEDQVEHP